MTYRLQAIHANGRTRLIPRELTIEGEQEWPMGAGSMVVTQRSTRTPGVGFPYVCVLFTEALRHPAEGVVAYRIVDQTGAVVEAQEIGLGRAA